MNRLKKYALLSLTLFFIPLGAAMPKLASQIQDFRLRGFQKEMELGAVKLTLRQAGDVGPVLQLISRAHTENPWEGETALSEADARQAALDVVKTMEQYGLLPEEDAKRLQTEGGNVEPQLLVGEDGSAALTWFCAWDPPFPLYITIDDATGKAVRILTGRAEAESELSEAFTDCPERWYTFLQEYYDLAFTAENGASGEGGNRPPALFRLCLSSKDGSMQYTLNLEITDNFVFFNYYVD